MTRRIFLGAFAVFFALPLLWLALAPTRTADDLIGGPPLGFGSLANVATAWGNLMTFNDGELTLWIANSIGYAAGSVTLSLLLSVPAGYALAKYDFAGRAAVLTLTLIGMILPQAALVLPLYLEMTVLGLTGTAWSVILPLSFYPFGVYLCYLHFAAALPHAILDAGRVDGAGELRLFVVIGLPLARPAIGLVAFFAFVNVWTNFFLPFVMLDDDRTFTLQLGLMTLLQSTGAVNASSGFSSLPIHQPEAALAGLVACAPTLLAFLLAQRALRTGMLAGAEKG
ncbi:carbohydrate ABC transporter permease [Nonomuraea basaltis]|uniref:carbohydrate ABC transporter permease n=1 Tax=Nonomuraea basaltis TaxID=2495887 RepID=UPI00110C6862|nr:carbohydrate ABC transporter permease [Nonomuraea basaltis]TMR90427.1 carbohydrate ABC transporter permease [Nonomuraea basaltis]